jgi:hypothetical protein
VIPVELYNEMEWVLDVTPSSVPKYDTLRQGNVGQIVFVDCKYATESSKVTIYDRVC